MSVTEFAVHFIYTAMHGHLDERSPLVRVRRKLAVCVYVSYSEIPSKLTGTPDTRRGTYSQTIDAFF